MTAEKKSPLDEIVATAEALKAHKAELAGFNDLLGEISNALAEVVEAVIKPNTHAADIAKAIKGLKLDVHMPDGAVHVHPSAAAVQVHASPVHVQVPQWKTLHVRTPSGAEYTITKE